jgi:RNA polymerase sigma-70 factor (ECF subfamily)
MERSVITDNELLQLARKFDPRALADIYDTFSPGIYRYAIRLTGDQDLAEECVAETFSRLLQAFKLRKGPRDYLQAYLYRIAHNWIVDYFRNKSNEPSKINDRHPDDEPSPEEQAGNVLENFQLRQAILALTPEQQQVIALKYLQGFDNMEIARILKKPVGAVKSLQHRALARLKKLMDQIEGSDAR